jgi:hypothetical protein
MTHDCHSLEDPSDDGPPFFADRDEMDEHQTAAEIYAQTREAYNHVIECEDCPLRREQLISLRCQLDEENR